MLDDRWEEAKAVIDAALDRSPQTRSEFIREKCGSDLELRAEVEAYLEFDSPDEDVLEDEMFPRGKNGDLIGQRIGKYRIVRELGAGGMGVVFLAERCDGEFSQTVAIKLLGHGLFSRSARARFLQEKRILAGLRHKNIAALIDGGATEEGIPFLIMEYVEGMPLTEFAEKHDLSIDERLKLFRKICEAVRFAHRNLIIHRDLKPANILVDADGEPKLLDFGIAKLINAGGESDLTETRQRAFTPEYASPEQIKGETVTTASDVYALGIVLYELLTGERPFKIKNAENHDEFREFASRENPPRPSSVANSRKNLNEKKHSPFIFHPKYIFPRDLDTIILKALKFKPEDRYESIGRFAADIENYRKNLPIAARPDAFGYRAGKFLRRNRLAVGAALVVLLAVVIGSFATMRQAALARAAETDAKARLAELRRLTGSMLFELNDEISQSPTKARLELAAKSSEFLNQISSESVEDKTVKFDLAVAYLKLGDLFGRPYHPNVGKTAEARQSYERSLDLLESLAAENASDEKIKAELARAHERFGYLLGTRFFEWKPAAEHLEKSMFLREELVALSPSNRDHRSALADAYLYYADTMHGRHAAVSDQPFDDESRYEIGKKSLELRKALLEEMPDDVKTKRSLATNYQRMAGMVPLTADDPERGEKLNEILFYHRESLRLREEMASSAEAAARDQRNLADQLMMMSDFLAANGRLSDAAADLRRSKEIFYSLTLVDPRNAESQYDYGNALWRLGAVLKRQKKLSEARKELSAGKTLAEKIVRENPTSAEYGGLLKLINEDLNSLR